MRRVVKIGGRVQRDPSLAAALAAAWRSAPGELCVVHGGGDEVTALQRTLGREPTFRGGRRVTTAHDIEALRMVLSGSANKRLVAALGAEGLLAVGLSGEDGALIGAQPTEAADMGHVGDPVRINASLLEHLLAGGYLPVISPLARNVMPRSVGFAGAWSGAESFPAPDADVTAALNVNGDDAAAAIAIAIGADELLLVSDVPGVLAGGVPVRELTTAGAQDLIATGQATGGMAAKLEAALRAIDRGISHVRIGDLAAIADPGRGTLLTHARSFA